MDSKDSIPQCCEKRMHIEVETATLYEAHCNACGDVIYIKKEKTAKPTMLDD